MEYRIYKAKVSDRQQNRCEKFTNFDKLSFKFCLIIVVTFARFCTDPNNISRHPRPFANFYAM